jgi:hypothetical protein
MNTALEYSTRVVQEGGPRYKKSTLNDLVHLTPLRIPLMNPPFFDVSYGNVLNDKKFWLQIWDEIIIGDSHSDHFVA